jgi:hypothetical protein
MFHPSQIDRVKNQIVSDLSSIEVLGSVKIYLCWYDEFLVSQSEWNGEYPCSDKSVSLQELIHLIKKVMMKQCIIRHNVLIDPIPVYISSQAESQSPLEKYIEVCLVY